MIIGVSNAATSDITQRLEFVGQEEGKLVAIRQLLAVGLTPPVLIFVQSIDRARQLFHELVYDNINVDMIHSERTRTQRDKIVENFRVSCRPIHSFAGRQNLGLDHHRGSGPRH